MDVRGQEKDRQKSKFGLTVFIDRSALLLLVSKLLQEEIIRLIIDINNWFSDMSENNLNSLYCTFEICTVA